jgi:hypothetical protein
MMESEGKFHNQSPIDKFCAEDGEIITFDELLNGFFKLMVKSQKILEFPDGKKEQKVRFIIGVYLVNEKLFSRTELDSDKAVNLIDRLYESFINLRETSDSSKKTSQSWEINSARRHQLREEKRAGQTYKESDLE